MKKKTKKLVLSKETVRTLAGVLGGDSHDTASTNGCPYTADASCGCGYSGEWSCVCQSNQFACPITANTCVGC